MGFEDVLSWAAEEVVTDAFWKSAAKRGLAAARALHKGEVVLHAAEAILMSSRSARGDKALGPLLATHPHLTSCQIIMVRYSS
eukprot:jgi/Mesen1/5500/ME000276S04625